MTIPPIESVAAPLVLPGIDSTTSPVVPGGFAGMIEEGVVGVERRIRVAEEGIAQFATGADIPPHQVMLALEDARMSLQFALQVRSRLVEGFQELMRMQL